MSPAYLKAPASKPATVGDSASGVADCHGKIAYPTQGMAQRAVGARKGGTVRNVRCRAYLCPCCHGWHLTDFTAEQSKRASKALRSSKGP